MLGSVDSTRLWFRKNRSRPNGFGTEGRSKEASTSSAIVLRKDKSKTNLERTEASSMLAEFVSCANSQLYY